MKSEKTFLLVAVNAKYIHSNLAIYSLKAYAQRRGNRTESGIRIVLGEYTINQNAEEILADIYGKSPDVIGFSCYIWNMELVKRLISLAAKVMPETQIWLGGPEVSFDAEEQLRAMPEVKGIMVGEGEETFSELLEYYGNRERPLSGISGLYYREGTEIYSTEPRHPMDLSAIPFPYGERTFAGKDSGQWSNDEFCRISEGCGQAAQSFSHKIMYYESSRGCPFSCAYCLSSLDKKLRFRDLQLVRQELQIFLDAKVAQVKFIDRTFNCKKSHAMAVWSYLAAHDNGITNFHFEIAADLLDEEMVRLLSALRPGQVQLEIGVQTTCEETLKAIERKTDLAQVKEMIRRISSSHNIHQHLDLIAGLPMEGYERFGQSFDQVYAMKPDQLQLGFLKVLRGSAMRERAEQYGLVYEDRPPYEVLSTRWLSYGELLGLKQIEELVETYYNSGQFVMTLRAMGHCWDSPFAMFREMANYFERQGFFGLNSNRETRYRRVCGFLEEKFPADREVYRQLLTWDYYLRENAKKRPSFAIDQEPWKEEISEFFARENQTNQYFPHYGNLSYRQLIYNVHLEIFTFDIPVMAQSGKKEERLTYVCYDYGKRDQLNHNGNVTIISNPLPSR